MSEISRSFRGFVPQLLHMIVLPVFFFVFMLIYRPFDVMDVFGNEWFGVHITIISSIILLSTVFVRLIYYFLPLKLNYTLYVFWCFAEMIFISFFAALYIWLVQGKPMPYFDMLTLTFKYVFFTLIISYAILALSLRVFDYHTKGLEPVDMNQRMRFYDDKHNLKFVVQPDAVLYIEADINYVNIFYLENGRQRSYTLRTSMKAINDLCQENGLLRCHRSFYVNPSHVKVLRKDKDGLVYAELDATDVKHIPVTKRYYERLADMLY